MNSNATESATFVVNIDLSKADVALNATRTKIDSTFGSTSQLSTAVVHTENVFGKLGSEVTKTSGTMLGAANAIGATTGAATAATSGIDAMAQALSTGSPLMIGLSVAALGLSLYVDHLEKTYQAQEKLKEGSDRVFDPLREERNKAGAFEKQTKIDLAALTLELEGVDRKAARAMVDYKEAISDVEDRMKSTQNTARWMIENRERQISKGMSLVEIESEIAKQSQAVAKAVEDVSTSDLRNANIELTALKIKRDRIQSDEVLISLNENLASSTKTYTAAINANNNALSNIKAAEALRAELRARDELAAKQKKQHEDWVAREKERRDASIKEAQDFAQGMQRVIGEARQRTREEQIRDEEGLSPLAGVEGQQFFQAMLEMERKFADDEVTIAEEKARAVEEIYQRHSEARLRIEYEAQSRIAKIPGEMLSQGLEGALGNAIASVNGFFGELASGQEHAAERAQASFLTSTGNQLVGIGTKAIWEGAIMAVSPATAPMGIAIASLGVGAVAAGIGMGASGAAISASIPSSTGTASFGGSRSRSRGGSSSTGGTTIINNFGASLSTRGEVGAAVVEAVRVANRRQVR